MKILVHVGAAIVGVTVVPAGLWLADMLPTKRGGFLLLSILMSLSVVALSQILVFAAREAAGAKVERARI